MLTVEAVMVDLLLIVNPNHVFTGKHLSVLMVDPNAPWSTM
jgi:hypothetical protein